MQIYCSGKAIVQHKATKTIYEINEDELNWEPVGGDDRSMGPEYTYEAKVVHEQLGELTWTVSEYPVGVENSCEFDVGEHSLLENFDFGLEHVPEFDSYEAWLDENSPDDPRQTHTDSYYHTCDILADYVGHHSEEIVGRLVFTHQISALEAYLADTLINQVMSDDEALRKLLASDPDLLKSKFTLAEVFADHEPRRVCRRPFFLREWTYDRQEAETSLLA